ncbi:MAG: hypothetical protein BWY86_01274 [Candidatus Aminicenantes bacterium ADurb.Bin508]|nr:MAG: hypothetical protein BWY86_01274 [Candidatus Aminicenantes bacterium ADurb.Bin508]
MVNLFQEKVLLLQQVSHLLLALPLIGNVQKEADEAREVAGRIFLG